MLASELMADTREIDPNAETLREIMDKTGHGRVMARKIILSLLESDKLEQVWKRTGRGITMAYRAKKKIS